MKNLKNILLSFLVLAFAKEKNTVSPNSYKKRVLDNIEISFLSNYYLQDGSNAAVSGGIGTEYLTETNPAIIVSIPLNEDDVLTIDAGISAYTSASSSNINPFDKKNADPYQASSGASSSDVWSNVTGEYNHSSNDRNMTWSSRLSISSEYDYSSVGLGGSCARLFNRKDTEVSISANIFLDTWRPIYPKELIPFAPGGNGINNKLFTQKTIFGNPDYNPVFSKFTQHSRNSYSLGLVFSQILSQKLQGSLAFDFVWQRGLLSTPFQRVYFSDTPDSFIDNFQLADDIERLPNSRIKIAIGDRLNFYLNETFVLRTYYRYYFDDWDILSNTFKIEIPVKITDMFTLYPSYRFYNQTPSRYFAPFEQHTSTETFYTSDYDLSGFRANQYSFGITYTDIFTNYHIWKLGMKSVDFKITRYKRDSGFKSLMFSAGLNFVVD